MVRFVLCTLLCGLAFCAYLNSIRGAFVYDDIANVAQNQYIRNLYNWQDLLLNPDARSSLPSLSRKNYRPLFNLLNAFDYHFWGMNTFGYHLTNILLHILTGLLLFVLLEYLVPNPLTSFLATLFFLLHPANVEAVANISGRSSSISSIFFLVSLLAYIHWDRTGSRKTAAFAYLFFFPSLLGRETSVVLPVLLFFYEVMIAKKDWRARMVWLRLLPFVLLTIGYLVLRNHVIGSWAQHSYWGGSMLINDLTSLKILYLYFKMLVLPVRLIAEYRVQTVQSPYDSGLWAGFFALIFLGYWLYTQRRIKPWVTFGGLWFLLGLLPVLNLVPLDSLLNDRFLYFPLAGACLVLAEYLRKAMVAPARIRGVILSCVCLALVFTMALTMRRNLVWISEEALYGDTLTKNPYSPRACNGMGLLLLRENRAEDALMLFRAGLLADPYYGQLFYNYVQALIQLRRFQEADEQLKKNSDHMEDPNYHHVYALLYKEKGHYRRALESINKAIDLNPFLADYYITRSKIYYAMGDLEAAARDLNKVSEIAR